MTKAEVHTTLNKISVDCIILIGLLLPMLVIIGNYKEHGDSNAGSMYGLYILPAIPIIIVALGLITTSNIYLKSSRKWLSILTPLILMISAFWLDHHEIKFLMTILVTIIVYSIIKRVLIKRSPYN
jgi:hypothetical protein